METRKTDLSATSIVQRHEGFSVAELLMVMAISAIVGSLAILPFQSWRTAYELEGIGRQLVTDLHFVRMRAMTRNTTTQFVFQSGSYELQVAGTVETVRSLPVGVSMTNPGAPVVFLPRGMVQAGSDGSITISNSAGSKTITVNSVGGIEMN